MEKYRTCDEKLINMHRMYSYADRLPTPIYRHIEKMFGDYAIIRSILQPGIEEERKFRWLLEKMCPGTLLEIGTAKGVSALIASMHFEKVITVDIEKFPMAEVLWFVFRKRDVIDSYIIDHNEEKESLIATLDFDCAFIDGDHRYEGIEMDFNAVKRCGKVLFHDYWETEDKCTGPREFIDTLPKDQLTFDKPFVLWETK